jgi:hypothetical protein
MKAFLIKTAKNLVLKLQGKTYTVPQDQVDVEQIVDLVKNDASPEEILPLVDYKEKIRRDYGDCSFHVDDEQNVYIDDEQLPKTIADRLFGYSESNVIERVEAIVRFWKKVKANPDVRAQTDLFKFLEHNNMPITSEGNFLGYRYVKYNDDGDLVDSYTGTMNNNIGTTVIMDRSKCCADPNIACAAGLHVGSYGYSVSQGRTVVSAEVDPTDVVSVPYDYNCQKLRCCKFKVVELIQGGETKVEKAPQFQQTIVNDLSKFMLVVNTTDVL